MKPEETPISWWIFAAAIVAAAFWAVVAHLIIGGLA